MQNTNFLQTELLDILFRGKNKQYGAYTLRKFYAQRIRNAMLITVSLLLTFFSFSLIKGQAVGGIVIPTDYQEQVRVIKDILIQRVDKPGKAGRPPVTKIIPNDIPTVIVPDVEVTLIKPIKKDKDILSPPNDVFTTTGGPPVGTSQPPGHGGTSPTATGPPSTGNGKVGLAAPPAKVEPKILELAQQMPEFPGGEEAMMRFLQSNIKFPKIAQINGVVGIVYLEFVVSDKGEIVNVKIKKGLGSGCDREAVRVVKSMPTWKPGVQNGSKVFVSFVLPVEFE